MVRHTTPYEYGGELPDGGLGGDEPPVESETVIVDGAAMSYRSYRRSGGG
jgi:hypothetical protein